MLNLKKIFKTYEDSARSFAEFVPWMLLAHPKAVLNKDGSFLACYKVDGVDAEGITQAESDSISDVLEHALRSLDERFTVYWQVDRRKQVNFANGFYADPISDLVNRAWRQSVSASGQYSNRHYFCILYTPVKGLEAFSDTVQHYVRKEGMSYFDALKRTAYQHVMHQSAFAYHSAQTASLLKDFLNKLDNFESIVSTIGLHALRDEDLLGYLHRRCSPSSTLEKVKKPNTPIYLDSYLPGDYLVSQDDVLRFQGNQDKYVGVLSIKDTPDWTFPGLLDSILSIPGELTVTAVMRLQNSDKSRKYIQNAEREHRNSSKSIITYAMEGLTKEPSAKVDVGKLALAVDSSDALTEISTKNAIYGYFNIMAMGYGDTPIEVDDCCKAINRVLENYQFIAIRERMNLLSCFSGSIPGQIGSLVRWMHFQTANFADLAMIRTFHAGSSINVHYTEQFGTPGNPIPALTVIPTEYSTAYNFNFHVGQLAHCLVVGPSRMGKSAFNNFLISQFQKYRNALTIIFDKDGSCMIPTLLQGGTHIDPAGEGTSSIKCNPVSMIRDGEDGIRAFANWLEILIEARGFNITAEHDEAIMKAIKLALAGSEDLQTLTGFSVLLTKELQLELRRWLQGGINGKFFDNKEDDFSLGRWTCIEMNGLFNDGVVARAFLDYAFYKIMKMLDGRPAIIYLEEVWFLLEDEKFRRKLNDWLRTLAKRNVFLVMATQSLDEIAKSDIFSAMIDNIPNRIYLPNPNAFAHFDMYRDQFGLNEVQIQRISQATKNYNYYLVNPEVSRMLCCSLPEVIRAVVRSDSKAKEIFFKYYDPNAFNDNWKMNYLRDITEGRVQ